MRGGMNAVLAALDATPAPVRFFLRDDDAGWDDARLFALLDCVAQAGASIDLAVIPQAAGAALAAELRARFDAAPDLLGLHQHGFAHVNHEGIGRKCEFGASRTLDSQRRDLIEGRERLRQCFGERLDPIFTPPWNRCAAATPSLLVELGYAALSRDAGATPQHALNEISVHVDWCKQRRRDDSGAAIARDLARHVAGGATIGLMLHHAQMDESDLALLAAWLPQLKRHLRVRWTPMRELMYETARGALCC
jgi:hypothetical protein